MSNQLAQARKAAKQAIEQAEKAARLLQEQEDIAAGERFVSGLEKLELAPSHLTTARAFGISLRQIQRIAAGGTPVPLTMRHLMEMYLQHGVPDRALEAIEQSKKEEKIATERFVYALDKLKLAVASQPTVRALGISLRQVQRIAAGDTPVPKPVRRLLEMYLKHGVPEEMLEEAA